MLERQDLSTADSLNTSSYVEMGKVHLSFKEDTPFEVWEAVTTQLISAEKSIRWWIGDTLRYGENRYGEKYTQAIEESPYTYGTLANSVYVANKYEDVSLRNEKASFSFHEIAAPLEPKERFELLDKASTQGWTAKQLREEVRDRRILSANLAQEEENGQAMMICPSCDGNGLVAAKKALKIRKKSK